MERMGDGEIGIFSLENYSPFARNITFRFNLIYNNMFGYKLKKILRRYK
jgi:hypothetical protein